MPRVGTTLTIFSVDTVDTTLRSMNNGEYYGPVTVGIQLAYSSTEQSRQQTNISKNKRECIKRRGGLNLIVNIYEHRNQCYSLSLP